MKKNKKGRKDMKSMMDMKKRWGGLMATLAVMIPVVGIGGACLAGGGRGSGGVVSGAKAGENNYVCTEIVLSETVNNPSAKSDVDAAGVGGLVGFVKGDVKLTNWSNANYKGIGADGVATSAIKIGGSSKGKYSGSFMVSSESYTFCKAIVWASGWAGDNAGKLVVNDVEMSVPSTEKNAGYVYKSYTFEFPVSGSVVFTNAVDAGNKQRIVISRIIFRSYKV